MSDNLTNNLSALRLNPQVGYPGLASQVELAEPVDWAELVDDDLLLKVDGKEVRAYGEGAVERIEARLKEIQPRDHNGLSLVVGAGLGHFLDVLFRTSAVGHYVILVEPEPYMLRLAFERYDFSGQIRHGWLHITRPETERLKKTIWGIPEPRYIKPMLMTRENTNLGIRYYKIFSQAREQMLVRAAQVKTQIGRGLMINLNVLNALPKMALSPGVKEIEGLFKGYPAIVVAAGPSLDLNIHHLREAKAVIICLAQTLRALLAYDIRPDIVVSVDMQPLFIKHLEGLFDSDIPMVASCQSYYEAINSWQGPVYVAGVPGEENDKHYLTGLWKQKGIIQLDSAAIHFAYRLAIHVGADPVILVGCDLAGENQADHYSQYRLETEERAETANELVDGYWGLPVASKVNWMGQKTQLEGLIAREDQPLVINATEGGANIKGTKQFLLTDTTERWCTKEIEPGLRAFLKAGPLLESVEGQLPKGLTVQFLLDRLSDDIDSLNKVIGLSSPALDLNLKMTKLLNRIGLVALQYNKYRKAAVKQVQLSKEVQKAAVKVKFLMQTIATEFYKAQSKAEAVEAGDNLAHIQDTLRQNKVLLTAAKTTAIKLLEAYEAARDEFEDYLETGDPAPILLPYYLESLEPDREIEAAQADLDGGNFVYAIHRCRKIMPFIGDKKAEMLLAEAVMKREEHIAGAIMKYAEIQKRLGDLYMKGDKPWEAMARYQAALVADPDCPGAEDALKGAEKAIQQASPNKVAIA
uniref:6-hydroxymethylpterin diphosphokinase MptE-like domain-containing protein n=1 Tax=viral metagenome TaxID=1070528 RepID=A0A6M3L0P0_9ZZZZ